MKLLLLFLLISQLFGSIHKLKKYGDTPKIYNLKNSYSGFVVLDASDFDEGDSIYITYHTYEGKYGYETRYVFSNEFPTSEDKSILTNVLSCYSDGVSSTEHNESTGYSYRIYYTYDYYYFFEFIKPNNTKYLIMEYDLYHSDADYLEVSNTRFRRYILTLIIVGSIVGFLLVCGAIFFIYIKRDKFNCDCDCDCDCCSNIISVICCPFTFCCNKKVYSSQISNGVDENQTEISMKPSDSYPTPVDFANIQNENPSQKPEVQDILLESNNNNYNEVAPEKPYYEQDSNQISTYAPPQFQVYQKPSDEENQNQNSVTPPPQTNYEVNNINEKNTEPPEQNNLNINNIGQNDINSNNNQNPQNPPSDNNQNDIGYSSGGNGIYQ